MFVYDVINLFTIFHLFVQYNVKNFLLLSWLGNTNVLILKNHFFFSFCMLCFCKMYIFSVKPCLFLQGFRVIALNVKFIK